MANSGGAQLLVAALVAAAISCAVPKTAAAYQCQSEGFHVDPADCSKFIRCVDQWQNGQHLTPFRFSCPAGEFSASLYRAEFSAF